MTALISGEAVTRVILSFLHKVDNVSVQETPAIPPPITTIVSVSAILLKRYMNQTERSDMSQIPCKVNHNMNEVVWTSGCKKKKKSSFKTDFYTMKS